MVQVVHHGVPSIRIQHARPSQSISAQGDPHEALESGTGIFQAERHADVAKHTTRGEKCCLLLVLLRHLDLVIAWEGIQKTEGRNNKKKKDPLSISYSKFKDWKHCNKHGESKRKMGLIDGLCSTFYSFFLYLPFCPQLSFFSNSFLSFFFSFFVFVTFLS